MADNDVVINGVNGDSSEFLDADADDRPSTKKSPDSDAVGDLNRRIEALELEKSKLERENGESAHRIGQLKDQVVDLRREKEAETERAESESKAAEAIAKRASELEGDVFRLQHDLITSMNTGEELSREIQNLQAKIGELEEKARREKDEMEALRRENKVAEDSINKLEAMLEDSNKKVKVMEEKMEELEKKSTESDELIGGLVEKVEEREREAIAEDEKSSTCSNGFKGLKTQLPLIGAVSAGAIVATMAVIYIRHSRN